MTSEVGIRDLTTQPPIRNVSRTSLSNKESPLGSASSSVNASPSTSRNGSTSRNPFVNSNAVEQNSPRNNETNDETATNSSGNRRPSFGLNFLSSFTTSIRSHNPNAPQGLNSQNGDMSSHSTQESPSRPFMSNSPTIANFNHYNIDNNLQSSNEPISPIVENHQNEEHLEETHDMDVTMVTPKENDNNVLNATSSNDNGNVSANSSDPAPIINNSNALDELTEVITPEPPITSTTEEESDSNKDKDGLYSVRLTPLIDHSSSNTGLYFAPIIRKTKSNLMITIGRYTEKNKAAAHAPQGSNAPIVFKSKVVSRTHASFQCNEEGQWFVKDCKSSSGTFLNHIRLSPASQESSLMPLVDGDIIQLGMDYRGGTEEVYRCVKMRCEFNKSWQRKVNQFNLQIHQKLKNLSLQQPNGEISNPINNALKNDELSECAICLLKLEPCQALFISPCSHSWHYKCIRPIIIKSYPQFYCPNCRSMCDLETDIEDDDD